MATYYVDFNNGSDSNNGTPPSIGAFECVTERSNAGVRGTR